MSREARRAGAFMAGAERALRRGDVEGARRGLAEALDLRRAVYGSRHVKVAETLDKLAAALAALGDYDAARRGYGEAVAIRRDLFDPDHLSIAASLTGLGRATLSAGDAAAARLHHEEALAIRRRRLGEDDLEVAASLNGLGAVAAATGDFAAARGPFEAALAIRRRVLGAPHHDVAASLNNLGLLAGLMGDGAAARAALVESLDMLRSLFGDQHAGAAMTLSNLGNVHRDLGELAAARDCHERSLAIRIALFGDHHPEVGVSLNNLGLVLQEQGDFAGARDRHERSLAIKRRRLGDDHPDVATSLNNLGIVQHCLGDYVAAQDLYRQAIAIARRTVGETHPEVARYLNNLGAVTFDLGDFAAARDHQRLALAIRRAALGDEHPDVAMSLNNLGNLARELGDLGAAQDDHERALAIWRKAFGDVHPEVARSLNNLGNLSSDRRDLAAARDAYERSLAAWRQALGDTHPDLCFPLVGLAKVLRIEGDLDRALSAAGEALRITLLVDDGIHLPTAYRELSLLAAAQGAPDAAIFLGKQAVNAVQRRRGRLTGLDGDLQRSFLATKEDLYRGLADLLVEAGRLGEAQQVLAMLKEEELFDLLRRDAETDPRTTFAALTSLEAAWQRHGDAIGQDLVRLTGDIAALRALPVRTAEEDARLRSARAELDAAGRAFRTWLDGLRGDLAASASHDAHSAAVNLDLLERLQGELRALGPGVALLSYVLGESKLSVILTTAALQVSRDAPVPERTVNRLVHEFRLALDQRLDGEAGDLGRALWRHLVAPVADLLEEIGAETLMVVPYGTLRYLPMAALHDGTGYLVERFAVSVLTLAAQGGLRERPGQDWRMAGLGVAREVSGYRRLPAVAEELGGIVRTSPDGAGIYPGVIRLDEAFTEESLVAALEAHQALHVASHFVLNPAQGLRSHLLLGDGSTLSLDRLRDVSFDFHAVDLITLSACETAMGGGRENGREFEGFAALVQQRGAKAVIASLWPVADVSTAPLMRAFYRARRDGRSKAAALRDAQLALLRGHYPHPYHWAPFILMGNWL